LFFKADVGGDICHGRMNLPNVNSIITILP